MLFLWHSEFKTFSEGFSICSKHAEHINRAMNLEGT